MACGKKNIPLNGAFDKVTALAEHQLRCLETNDVACFNRGLLTYQEFHDSVYQYLPEGKDKVANISEDVYWGWTLPDRKKAVKKLFEQFGGMKLVSFTVGTPKKILNLDSMKLHRDIPLDVEWLDAKQNKKAFIHSTEILKAVVEVNGQYKLWNMTYE